MRPAKLPPATGRLNAFAFADPLVPGTITYPEPSRPSRDCNSFRAAPLRPETVSTIGARFISVDSATDRCATWATRRAVVEGSRIWSRLRELPAPVGYRRSGTIAAAGVTPAMRLGEPVRLYETEPSRRSPR